MEIEREQAKTGSKVLLVSAVYDLAFVAAVLLSISMGSAPPKHATFSIEAARPGAAKVVSVTADATSPRKEIADTDSLDLQLD